MFPVSEFLIYCFVSAYTPGANNLLSMSNAARLGFRRSVRFNIGEYTGALKAPVRCFGNHLSGKGKSSFQTDNECSGAAILKK